MIALNGMERRRFGSQRKKRKNDRVPDPTPMQIERRAALVRAKWDEETRMKRAGLLPEDFEATVTEVDMRPPGHSSAIRSSD